MTRAVTTSSPLAVLLCFALLTGNQAANANRIEPAVPLASVTDSIWFGRAPIPERPDGIVLGYGIYVEPELPVQGGVVPVAVVFDDLIVQPSDERQTFSVFVGEDPDATALAEAIEDRDIPGNADISFASAFAGDGLRRSLDDDLMRIPHGTAIEGFRLEVPPFRIEQADFGRFGNELLGYEVVVSEDDHIASISAIGLPPRGDANCSGAVSVHDSLLILQFSASFLDALPCKKSADVNADSVADARDAGIILQIEGGLFEPA